MLEIIPATLADYPAIQNMARFYVYDMSRYCGFISPDWAIRENGLYECFDFKRSFEEPNRKAFLVKIGDELAGFVLLLKDNEVWQVDEFFILAKFQGKGIGKQVAHQIWKMHPGDWSLTVIPENSRGLAFWKKTVGTFTNGKYNESTIKVDYDVHQPNRILFEFSSSPYHLRLATIADAADIVDLQVRGWKHSYKGIVDQSHLDNIDSKKRLEWRLENMAKGTSWTFVVEHEGKIVGECDVGVSRSPEFGKGEIFAFYVDKDHHRKGIGTMLWDAAVAKLSEENLIPFIVVTLGENSPARKFYESMGCMPCGETKTPINDKLYDEVIYKCEAHKTRPAKVEDVTAMVELSYQKRRLYEKIQPAFWKYAEGAEEAQSKWFKELLEQDNHILLVTEMNQKIIGFSIGKLMKAPEVYNPGGPTLMVDDFCVEESRLWQTVGLQLITEIKKIAKQKEAVQILVVCGDHDQPKKQFLYDKRLSIASNWFVGKIA